MLVRLSGALDGHWVEVAPFTLADMVALEGATSKQRRAMVAAHITDGDLPCQATAEGLRSLKPKQFAALLDGLAYGEPVDYRRLHDAIEGEAQAPYEWLVSRLCEEGLARSVNDALQQPYSTSLAVLTMRQYARAKRLVEDAKQQSDLPDTPMVREVNRVLIEKHQEARKRH